MPPDYRHGGIKKVFFGVCVGGGGLELLNFCYKESKYTPHPKFFLGGAGGEGAGVSELFLKRIQIKKNKNFFLFGF